MIDITGVPQTPIYKNRMIRRYVIQRIAEDVSKTGRVDSAYVKAAGALLKTLDGEVSEMGTIKHLCQRVYV